jgi:hypothetical protein
MITFKQFISEEWHDSQAKDANGRWAKYRDGKISVDAMATWLYNSRAQGDKAGKLKSCYGAIAQQENTSKLISKSKADSLRAAIKRKYGMKLQELHQNTRPLVEGRVKDAMLDLVERAVDAVQGSTDLSYDKDKNEFCMAVAKKVIDLDKHELFAGNRSEAYEWVKDYVADL